MDPGHLLHGYIGKLQSCQKVFLFAINIKSFDEK